MAKHKIWSSEINIEDWKDFLEEEHPDVDDEYEQYQLCADLNNDYLDDERCNLKKAMPILCIANLGLWNRRCSGYKKFTNVSDIFYSQMNCSCEMEFFVENDDLKAIEYHHDGTNYYTFYQIREDRAYGNGRNGYLRFLDSIREGKEVSIHRIMYYCKHLGWWPKQVYGWVD